MDRKTATYENGVKYARKFISENCQEVSATSLELDLTYQSTSAIQMFMVNHAIICPLYLDTLHVTLKADQGLIRLKLASILLQHPVIVTLKVIFTQVSPPIVPCIYAT